MAGLTEISLGNFTEVRFAAADAADDTLIEAGTDNVNIVGEVQSVGDISDEATIVDVQAYGQKYLKKLVGSANAAAIEVVCNYQPTDGGQTDLLLAYTSSTPRNISIVMLDTDAGTNGTHTTFTALIASASISNSFDETRTITFSVVPINGVGAYTAIN